MRRLPLLIAILIFGLAFYLRVHALTTYPPGVNFDESVEIVDAGMILQAHEIQMVYYGDERSEGLSRVLLAFSTLFIGQSIFAYRLTNGLLSLLAIAAAGGAARQMFAPRSKAAAEVAMLTAISVLTVNQSYLTLSRAMYRGISTVLFTGLFLFFLWKALNWVHSPGINSWATSKGSSGLKPTVNSAALARWKDFALAGLCLGLIPQTYTAGLFGTGLAGVLLLHLIVFQGWKWRRWLPGVALLLLIFGILFAPTLYLLQTNPDRVIGRAKIVSSDSNLSQSEDLRQRFDMIRHQFTTSGDPNPQYNSQRAPLLLPYTYWLFYLGMGICILLLFRAPFAMTAALLLLSIFPVMLSNEIPHGLRIVLAFAAIPLIYAAAIGQMIAWLERFKLAKWGILIFALGLLVYVPTQAARISAEYRSYYSADDPIWQIWGAKLTNGEWFFLPQYRYMAAQIIAQDEPVYLSIQDAGNPILHSQLLQVYPNTRTWVDLPDGLDHLPAGRLMAVDDIQNTPSDRIVPGFQILVYVPPDDDTLYILPPLTEASAAAVRDTVRHGETLTHPNHAYPIGYTSREPVTSLFEFAPVQSSTGVTYGDRMQVVGYTGDPILVPGQTQTYCLIWTATRNMARNQLTRVQIWSHDAHGVAGSGSDLWRWLYPTMLWQPGDRVPDCYTFEMASDLPPGIYQLMVGVYERHFPMMAAADPNGNPLYEIAMVGVLKIPAPPMTAQPNYRLETTLTLPNDHKISLLGYNGAMPDPGTAFDLTLFWQAQGVPDQSYTIFIHVIDDSGAIIAQQDIEPWAGQYPTLIWADGEIVQTQHQLAIPENAQPPFEVYVGMYSTLDFQRLPAIQNGQPGNEERILLNFGE